MNYKEVLEKQITMLEKVQKGVLEDILEGKENTPYTQTTLNTIASTALKIQSLVMTIVANEKKNITNETENGEESKTVPEIVVLIDSREITNSIAKHLDTKKKVEKICDLLEGISLSEWIRLRECIDREFNSQANKTRFIKRDTFIKDLDVEFIQ